MGNFVNLLMMFQNEKILIIRFSSFGDVVQSLSLPSALATRFSDAKIHWVTRLDMAPLLQGHPHIHQVWSFDRKQGLKGLWDLAFQLRKQGYTRVYDAHNNLRSRFLSFLLLGIFSFFNSQFFIRRSIRRWKRFLLFRFRINKFEQPFSGQRDLLEPLHLWKIPAILPPAPQIFISQDSNKTALNLIQEFQGAIALAPSSAHFLKRWPKAHWQVLIQKLPQEKFILLGGPEDTFLEDIVAIAPERILNLAGKCTLQSSCAVIQNSRLLIANDTGLLHVAEQLGKNCIALIGPAPFGFPSRSNTKIMQLDLSCRPCSKHGQGPCVNSQFQKCLVDITPEQVSSQVQNILRKTLE